jgi:hypothetical protein
MEPNESVSRLLRLKRYEQPPPGYFEDFLAEFQSRQRAEVIQRPLWAIAWDRVARVLAPPTVPRLAMAGSFAAVVLASTLLLGPETQVAPPVEMTRLNLAASAPSLPLPKTSLRPARPLSSVQYVLPANPVGYASSRSF